MDQKFMTESHSVQFPGGGVLTHLLYDVGPWENVSCSGDHCVLSVWLVTICSFSISMKTFQLHEATMKKFHDFSGPGAGSDRLDLTHNNMFLWMMEKH